MTACSPKEELEWRSRLVERSERDDVDFGEQAVLSTLSLKIKPLGTVFGKPGKFLSNVRIGVMLNSVVGTIARRLSIHRATTVGPTSLCQVIIKNTTATKEQSSYSSINRSASLLTTNRIPVLAPLRAERVRIETLLADVWTRDVLPFPGMTNRVRTDHIVRSSAHSMMRKLSVASITSNFSKRSVSSASTRGTATTPGRYSVDTRRLPSESGAKDRIPAHRSMDALRQTHSPGKPKIKIFEFEKENNFRAGSTESLFALGGLYASPSARRLTPLQTKKSSIRDGDPMITPQLRTSSANSALPRRISSLSTGAGSQAEDQSSLSPLVPAMSPALSDHSGNKKSRIKVHGLRRVVVVDGLKGFFR